MLKKIIILTLLFYFLVLLQTSFFVHFKVLGLIPNLILISVILVSVFEKPENYAGLFVSFIGGFFLDIFSTGFIGLYALAYFALSLFIKQVFKKHVRASLG